MSKLKTEIMALTKQALSSLNEDDKDGDLKTLRGIHLFLTGSVAALSAAATTTAADTGGDFGEEGGAEFGAEEGGEFGEEGGEFGSEESSEFGEEGGEFGEESADASSEFGEEGGDFGEEGAAEFGEESGDPDFGEEEPAKPARGKKEEDTYGGKTANELVEILKANGVPGAKLKELWNKGKGAAIIKFARETDELAAKWAKKFEKGAIAQVEAFAKKKGVEVKYGPGRKGDDTKKLKIADAFAAKGMQL